MADFRSARRFRAADYDNRLRVTAVATVITGVVLLALAAFLLSYEAIHQIALNARVSPALAGLYPLILYAMLVLACVAALALREAGWWMRGYAWFSILVLLAAAALADAAQAADITLPQRPMAAAIAAIPWALLLLGFGLWLLMLRHLRTFHAARALNELRRQVRAADTTGGPDPMEDQQPGTGFPFWDSEPDALYAEQGSPYAEEDSPYAESHSPYGPYAEPADNTNDTPYVRVIPAQPQGHNSAAAPDSFDARVTRAHDPGTAPDNPGVRVPPARPKAHDPGAPYGTPDVGVIPARPEPDD